MNIKNIITGAFTICLLAGLFASCKKKSEEPAAPVNPTLSKTAINMDVNTKDSSVTITGGVAPYTVVSSDPNKVTVTLKDNNTLLLVAGKTTASSSAPVTVTITGKDKGVSSLTITIGDPWADAKNDSRSRFEQTGASAFMPKLFNDSLMSGYHYFNIYRDKGKLLSSAKPKYGWSSIDSKQVFFLEIDGTPNSEGAKAGGRIYTRNNSSTSVWTTCSSVNVIKSESGITWIVYKLADGTQGLVVQPWIN